MIMDIAESKDFLIKLVDLNLDRHISTHKRLAVMRYMKTYIYRMADCEVDEAVKEGKRALKLGEDRDLLAPDLAYKFNQASKGYDNWMAKHGRQQPRTREEKEKATRRLRVWADAGFPGAAGKRMK